MTAPLTLVYVGPTLPAAEAQALLPGASIRGPVAVGDVLRLLDDRAIVRRLARIAIVDGYFERMAAVWHKELLLALERGIEVWGAASMGALRAAELAPFGMRGVGAIAEQFATGALVADDEVAVAHLPAAYGYKPTSVALVDLRAGIAAMPRAVSAAHKRALVELARGRFYRERSWPQLLADATAARLPRAVLDAVRAAAATPSQKAADARLLLAELARRRPRIPRPPARRTVPRTWALAQLRAYLAAHPAPAEP